MSALAISTGLDQTRDRLLADLAVTERRVRLAGISTALLEGGDGPPLVLLHGGIECGGAYWAPAISSLLDSHRVVIPDVPGLGESEPVARLDQATFADWFAELLQATCTEKPALIAHSLLGTLAARFAAEHGDLLESIADLRGARYWALPDATWAEGGGDQVRAASLRGKRGAVRPLGVLRPGPGPSAGPGLG